MTMDSREDIRDRLLADLARRGMLAGEDGSLCAPLTRWGQPAWRDVPAAGDAGAPQSLMDATARQRRLVEVACAEPACGDNACAAWVEDAFDALGLGFVGGHATELYERYCSLTDLADLKVGMAVAVGEHPYSAAGRRFGHVGLYVGDGRVMDCVEGRVRRAPLDLWLSTYGVMSAPRWGWLGGIDLNLA